MIKYSELLILKLIDIENKSFLGKVVNVYFDEDIKKVKGLIIKNDKIYKNKKFIPFESIINIDKDSITIVIENNSKNEVSYEEINLIDWEIITDKHECMGYIKDIIISENDGKILGFIISEGLIEDIVEGRKFLPYFKDMKIKNESLIIKEKNIKDIDKSNQYYKKLIELED